MASFLASLFFITAAEMGDKTQLVTLAFASRYRARDVLAGIFAATLLVHLFSVGIGQFLETIIPVNTIRLIAGLSFIAFAVWTLRGDTLNSEPGRGRFGPFLTVAIAFFLAELGDKTQLATITLATQYPSFVGVWLGSTLGMVLADGAAIVVGTTMGRRIPEKVVKLVAALIFFGFGVFTVAETIPGLF